MPKVRPAPQRVIAGRYILLDRLGKGSMGEVWLAEHRTLGSHVAIKFLRSGALRDAGAVSRFFDEARIAARLQTRHAVQVIDFGVTRDRLPYVVMEYLDGETLEERLRREGRLSPAFTHRILSQVARALQKAHGMGIVHRDLKPANIFLYADEEGCTQSKVLDFGIAKIEGVFERSGYDERPMGAPLRTDGTLMGTPTHMAPEQTVASAHVGHAADQWALGIVAYQCLTGELPFTGTDFESLFSAVRAGYVRPARELSPELPEALDAWFATVFAQRPEARFSCIRMCADALASALGAHSERSPVSIPSAHFASAELASPLSEPPEPLGYTSIPALPAAAAAAMPKRSPLPRTVATTPAPPSSPPPPPLARTQVAQLAATIVLSLVIAAGAIVVFPFAASGVPAPTPASAPASLGRAVLEGAGVRAGCVAPPSARAPAVVDDGDAPSPSPQIRVRPWSPGVPAQAGGSQAAGSGRSLSSYREMPY